ncbi:MAG: hypothetical protein IJX11_09675 [Bacteroidales bacterium]|nr:hypothetical protein [Bacteroidales bacterium]
MREFFRMRGRYIILLLSLLCCFVLGGRNEVPAVEEAGSAVSVAESVLTPTSCPKMSFAMAGVPASAGSNVHGTMRQCRCISILSLNSGWHDSECCPKGRPRFMEVSPVSVHHHQAIILLEKLLI